MGGLQKGVNDLESWCLNNGEFGKQLMTEWTGECEDGSHYELSEVAKASNKKFKWKCSKGHEWSTTVASRTSYKTDCPHCLRARLQKGVNDLESWCLTNGSFGKQLKSEWTGECEDGKLYEMDEVAKASSKKFKWVCSNGHEWLTTVKGRTIQRHCCPCCSKGKLGEKVSKSKLSEENNLQTWCSSHSLFGKQLMFEWTGECEDGKHYGLNEVARGSKKKFKWICSKGHEWFANVVNRTKHKQGCPHCFKNSQSEIISKAKLSEENSLKTWCLSCGSFGQQLMFEWTGECEDGKHYKIDGVARGSGKKFKWICSKGHNWSTTVASRTIGRSCPYCSGIYVSNENNLKTWCLNNGAFGKQLMTEWTGECEDNQHYEIDEVAKASRKKLKWICSKGHEWYVKINDRTSYKTGCPYCNNIGTSYPEQFIYHSLKQIYPSAENRCKVLKSIQNPRGIEFDIGIPDIPLCIEYSPTYWHEGKEERDQYKKDLCQKVNVRFIQIVEDSYNELEHTASDDYICFKMNYSQQDEILEVIVEYILKSLGHSISEVDLERVKQEAYESSKGIEKEIQDTD